MTELKEKNGKKLPKKCETIVERMAFGRGVGDESMTITDEMLQDARESATRERSRKAA